jgi:hypothetical protein
MQYWWGNTPMFWTGFYLAPAPDHPDTSWMANYNTIRGQGWGFAPLYVGRQAGWSNLTEAQGRSDAHNAADLATSAAVWTNSHLFLDIETGGTLPSNLISYIVGWESEIAVATPFRGGVYCSYQSASQINTALGGEIIPFWCWRLGCPHHRVANRLFRRPHRPSAVHR